MEPLRTLLLGKDNHGPADAGTRNTGVSSWLLVCRLRTRKIQDARQLTLT
jgi:hypothetical protein